MTPIDLSIVVVHLVHTKKAVLGTEYAAERRAEWAVYSHENA